VSPNPTVTRWARPVALDRPTEILGLAVLAVGVLLLTSVAHGFITRMESDRLLALGATSFLIGTGVFIGLFAARLVSSLRGQPTETPPPAAWLGWSLVASLPVGVLAMSFACGFPGCNSVCVGLTAGSVVVLGLGALVKRRAGAAPLALAVILVYAVPHCICDNPINGWWIDRLGYSPNCFALPLIGMGFAVLGLRGIWPRLSLLLALATAGASATFASGHHLLSYPW
jgi:hypothetical protein